VVVLHAGNMGAKQGLDNVVEAARLASEQLLPVRFVLLGDGHQRKHLEQLAANVGSLEFLPQVSNAKFSAALGAADILLVNELPGVAKMALPSKLTSYFVAGVPVLAATDPDGLTARELESSGAGIHIPAGQPDVLVRDALRLAADRKFSQRLGNAGRVYSDKYLSIGAALDEYERWIYDLAASRSPRHAMQGDQ
jgi:glycosyltransferase involved in cell wall biosynthesis